MLDVLFHKTSFKDKLIFKGGTSLSKCHHLINRFSEDIDVVIDWSALGYKAEPYEYRTNNQNLKFNLKVGLETEEFIKDVMLPELQQIVLNTLGTKATLEISPTDKQSILLHFDSCFLDNYHYINPYVIIELGCLSEVTPQQQSVIEPYIAQVFPNIFKDASTTLLTINPIRTFWDKALILHKEANRLNNIIPTRYSRHFYDIYCMAHSWVKEAALNNIALLEQVVEFKMKFYYCGYAKYLECLSNQFKLVPTKENTELFKEDYENMKKMIFKDPPKFCDIMDCLKQLEIEINERIIDYYKKI